MTTETNIQVWQDATSEPGQVQWIVSRCLLECHECGVWVEPAEDTVGCTARQ